MQPIRRVPIDSLPRTGQALFFPRREVKNGRYRLVNLRFVVMHGSAVFGPENDAMMRLVRLDVKASHCRFATPRSLDQIVRRGQGLELYRGIPANA